MRLIDVDVLMDIVEQQGYVTVDDIINAEPVKHGRWKQPRYTRAPLYVCSECDASAFKAHNYCPNCGAKMDGGADNGRQRTID